MLFLNIINLKIVWYLKLRNYEKLDNKNKFGNSENEKTNIAGLIKNEYTNKLHKSIEDYDKEEEMQEK